jgi:hypothetical protein
MFLSKKKKNKNEFVTYPAHQRVFSSKKATMEDLKRRHSEDVLSKLKNDSSVDTLSAPSPSTSESFLEKGGKTGEEKKKK